MGHFTPDRQTTQDEAIVTCCTCGKDFPESETVSVFMDKPTEHDTCDQCYDEWLEADFKIKENEDWFNENN